MCAVQRSFATVDFEAARRALDVDRRLREIPGDDVVRGFLFKMTEDAVARAGRGAVEAFRREIRPRSRWAFRSYPVRDYIEEAAAAAAILRPDDPVDAIRTLWRETHRYAPLLNAERFIALLGVDVLAAVRWLEQQRRTFASFGTWRLEEREPGYVVMHYFGEWIWIDSAHRGGMEGVLQACRREGSVEVVLDSPYDGHLHVRWR
jgi:uncharacterized protein (TIGR02265 family)